MKKTLLIACLAALVCSLPIAASAGEVLDRLLNTMMLDVSNGKANTDEFKTLTPANPIGQTFTTGPRTAEVSRIAINVAWWNESWTEDETLVITLWDSPERRSKVGSAEMPYKWREWEFGVIMFTLNAKVQPATQYYFELTVTGGDGTINGFHLGSDYDGGRAYENAKPADKSIWFEIHSRPQFDRDAAYAERFSHWNLDYPGLEKVKAAVEARDWDRAVDEMIAYYESRPDLVDPELAQVTIDPKYDRTLSDLAVDMKHKDDEGNIIDLGPNWNHFRTWRTRGGVGLTRGGLRGYLANAYKYTGEEKYAKAFNDMIFNFMDNLPNPLRSGLIKPDDRDVNPSPGPGIAGGSMGGSLGRGARMNQVWYYYSLVSKSPSFTRDVRAGMIFDMIDSARVIDAQKGGGNRAAQMATALYEFADRHPEFKKSREWFDKGIADTFANLMETIRRDGAFQEPTVGYHCLVVNRFTGTLLKCREWNLTVKPEWEKRTEKALEFILYNNQPDFHLPARGDAGLRIDGTEYLKRMAEYYNRADFLWAGTKGREGTPPLATSWQFPSEGWFVMRSDWSPDALYMNIRNGYNGSHGHSDHLSITLSAYGSNLVIDPGVYQYGTTETYELMRARSHATVTVDDRNANRPKGKNAFESMRGVDFFIGTNAGYQGADDIFHTRKIAFIKPDYWVMSDTVTGPGEHDVAVRFPFNPMSLSMDATTGICRTRLEKGNLMIVPSEDNGFSAEISDYLVPIGGLSNAPMLTYRAKTALPAALGTLLYPYRGTQSPDVKMQSIGAEAYRVMRGSDVDYVCFGDTDTSEIAFSGDAVAVRKSARGGLSLAWMNGTSVEVEGKPIAWSENAVGSLEVIYEGDTVTILAGASEPTLKIAALGARHFRVGYGPRQVVTGAVIEPFTD